MPVLRPGHRASAHVRLLTPPSSSSSSSSTRPSEAPDFRFCVEMGLVARSRAYQHKTVRALLAEISLALTNNGLINHMADERTPGSREWTVCSELAIPSKPKEYRWGIKIVSPFMRFSNWEKWGSRLRSVLDVLNRDFEITTTHQCFTHIHLVPSSGYWELAQVKNLAKSILYFENCLDLTAPPYRRHSVWARSNRNNHYFGTLNMPDCFACIDKQATIEALGQRMNWTAADSVTGNALRAKDDFQHDTYRWNFTNLNEGGGFGTIEFRQPPGVTNVTDLIAWVQLAGCFVRLGVLYGASMDPVTPALLSSLEEWLIYEAGWARLGYAWMMKDLLREAVSAAPSRQGHATPLAPITIDEDERLRKKMGDRKGMVAVKKYHRLLQRL